MSVFTEYSDKKEKLRKIITKAKQFEWFDDKEADGLMDKLDNDVLRIAIIGQMNCGKSTYVNSLVFENDVLPMAATTMTASLSVITYGEEAKIEVEFYSKEDWAQQVELSKLEYQEDSYDLKNLQIKAAKELVEYAKRLKRNTLDELLGTTQTDTLENLKDYVGCDGKYVSIVKLVRIYYPKEYLKGVEIVDTPGFNDPIKSRENRTTEFLTKADAVVMLLYAGQPFAANDRDLLMNHVRKSGVGKIVLGVNKYDVPYSSGDYSIEDIAKQVTAAIKKCLKNDNDRFMADLAKVTPIPISAEMALISHYPIEKIKGNDTHNKMWERCKDKLFDDIHCPKDLYDYSNVKQLDNCILELILKQKEEIVLNKVESAIIEKGKELIETAHTKLQNAKATYQLMQKDKTPNDIVEDLKNTITAVNNRIDTLDLDLNEKCIRGFNSDTKTELNSIFYKACQGCLGGISVWKSASKSVKMIDNILFDASNKLKCQFDKKIVILENQVRSYVMDAVKFINQEISKVLPGFDQIGFSNTIRALVEFTNTLGELFPNVEGEKEDSTWGSLLSDIFVIVVESVLDTITLGLYDHLNSIEEIEEIINKLKNGFSVEPTLEQTKADKDLLIANIRKACVEKVLEPVAKKIKEAAVSEEARQNKIKEAKQNIEDLETKGETLKKQFETIEAEMC